MNDIEQRVRDALRAEAAGVTEESLRLPDHPVRPVRPRRWPALVTGTAVAASIVGAIVLASGDSDPQEVAPAETTTAPPALTTTPLSSDITTSRPPDTTTSRPGSSTPSSPPGITQPELPTCGQQRCQVLQSVRVGPDTLELLAAPSSTHPGNQADWKVRLRGGPVLPGAPGFDSFVAADALRCAIVAGQPACLLDTYYLGDSDTTLGIGKDGSGWRFTGARFAPPFGALRMDVRDLGGNATLEVVSVESRFLSEGGGPEQEYWTATVWQWDGTRLGCVPRVTAKEELPGWPQVRPNLSTLDTAHCF